MLLKQKYSASVVSTASPNIFYMRFSLLRTPYLPTLISAGIFLVICIVLILFKQEGFLILDQRGIFFEYAYHPTSLLFGNTIEYPIGAWFFFRFIRIFADLSEPLFPALLQSYYFFFSLSMALAYVALWLLTIYYLRIQKAKKQLWYAALFIFLFVVANPYLVMSTFDVIPTLLTFSAILVISKYPRTSSLLLGIATTIKWFPAVLLPLCIYFLYKKYSKKTTYEYVSIFFASIAVTVLVGHFFIPLSIQKQSFLFHGARGIHIESTYGNTLLLAAKARILSPMKPIYAYHSYQIEGQGVRHMKNISFPLLFIALALVFFHSLKNFPEKNYPVWLIKYSTLLIMAFFLFNKVFSGQFAFWPWPFFILLLSSFPSKKRLLGALLYILAISLYPFLIYYQKEFILLEWFPIILLTLRNALFFALFFWCLFMTVPDEENQMEKTWHSQA